MKSIKAFFILVFRSALKPSAYPEILRRPFGNSFGYFFGLVALLTFGLYLSALPGLASEEARVHFLEILADLNQIFPDDLVITIKEGTLSTNKPNPVKINFKDSKGQERILAVIDTEAKPEDVSKYQTLVFVTATTMSWVEASGKVTTQPIANNPEVSIIDRARYDNTVGRIASALKPFAPVLGAFVIILLTLVILPMSFLGLSLYHFLFVLIYSVIAALIGVVFQLRLGLGKFFQMAIHGMTMPILFEKLFSLAGFTFFNSVPFLSSALFALFTCFVCLELKENSQERPNP